MQNTPCDNWIKVWMLQDALEAKEFKRKASTGKKKFKGWSKGGNFLLFYQLIIISVHDSTLMVWHSQEMAKQNFDLIQDIFRCFISLDLVYIYIYISVQVPFRLAPWCVKTDKREKEVLFLWVYVLSSFIHSAN